ncbi:MAG: zinc-ribbon domain-containing protein [Clostridia bacterium]|nr:zinc-ribbon domain-containing protein [Clostridia bacterium]
MFFYEGQSCPVCGQHFGETDDIVTCPECGAPHHRECWKREGHCHFADAHGTDQQWAKSEPSQAAASSATPTRSCPNCGSKNPEFAEFCAHCGRELDAQPDWSSAHSAQPHVNQYTPPPYGGFTSFNTTYRDPFGGVPRTEQIDGVSVETIAEVIGQNSGYYLPRFYKMSRSGGKLSWNWSSFLLSYNWLLYRKNLLWGILSFVFLTMLEVFYSYSALQLQEILETAGRVLPENTPFLLWIVLLSTGVTLVVHVLLGMFGTYLYMQQVLRKARKLQNDPDLHYNQNFLSTGGTSFALGVAPNLLMIFLQYLFILFTL